MSNYEEGSIIEGKVTGIKPFGAFVAIDEKKNKAWYTFLKSLTAMLKTLLMY